ncbi:MAG TPA: rhodanese-like domain-containing protein [Kofleriaceae bacterium]
MVTTLDPARAATLLADASVEVIDVRDADEYATGHIPGARLLPLDALRADVEAQLRPGHAIVFVCASGTRSLGAAKLAERFGYANVYSLDGGTRGWARAGLPIEHEETRAAA